MGTARGMPPEWLDEEGALFEGWDFSHVRGRMREDDLPWDYPRSARALVERAHSVLDIATGGGEVLSSVAPFPPLAVAIEGHPPNVTIARGRLQPLGVGVVRCGEVEPLPFPPGTFDLVLNRHGGLRLEEIRRVLAPAGHFLTQQVDGDRNLRDLQALFGAEPQWPENVLPRIVERLRGLGLQILEAREFHGDVTFADVGAIVYFLKAVPWLVPGFTVERYSAELMALQEALEGGRRLRFASGHFLVHARRPA
jgi:SAM-dependent methyltransferase